MQSFDKYTFRDYKDTDHYKSSETSAAVTASTASTASPKRNKAGVSVDAPPQVPTPATAVSAMGSKEVPVGSIGGSPDAASGRASTSEPSGAPLHPIGNGGLGPGYYWTQTLKEVTIHIDLEQGLMRLCNLMSCSMK